MKRFPLLAFGLVALTVGCQNGDGVVNLDDTGVGETDTDTDTDADSDADSDTDTDTDSDTDCEIGISYLDPGNNTTGVSVTPTLKAWFDETATLEQVGATLSGPDGDVDGDLALIGGDMGLSFTPGELDRSSTYTFTVTTCSDEGSASFETVAGPLDGEDLIGNVYEIDLNSVTWNSPDATTVSLLLSQLDDDHILVEVVSQDGGDETITLMGAFGTSSGQDMCLDTIDFSEADFSGNPYFQAGPEDTLFAAGGYEVNVYELEVSGAFAADGGSMESVGVTGYLDIRDVEYSGFAACDFVTCTACPNDGVEGCAFLDVEDEEAPLKSSYDLDETSGPEHADCP